MRCPLTRNMLDNPVSESAEIHAFEERLPLTKQDGRKSQVNFIDVAGSYVLPHRIGAAADLHIL